MNNKTNFEKAVKLSMNNWVNSLPEDFDLPEPSEDYKKAIKEMFGIDTDKQ